ncbi:MAG TPA: SDR family oxidoreductase [Kofleriaceae bacterium]|nr:SDR family oxidoreductase [Kofleriaceae bacterium]
MRSLAGKIAVVTGASSGVGRAIARAYAQAGAHVALIARGQVGLDAAAREVERLGGEAIALSLDVADSAAVDRAADAVVARWGRIDLWVNNAMISVLSPVSQMQPSEYRRVIEVNYLGYVHGTLAALRHMRSRDAGVIIQIGSALAYRSIPLQSAYCASKAAIRAFTESLRCELIHDSCKVEVTQLQLPAVNTPQFDVARSRLAGRPRPVAPVYQPEVIADAALWAATHPRREIWVGWPTVKAILGQRVIPGLLDRYLAKRAWSGQSTLGPAPRVIDNVDAPIDTDRGAHGAFEFEARGASSEMWLRTHRTAIGVALGAVAAALLLVRSR